MISVVVYGRNDSHGYNLHKRATISLNCIAEVLGLPGDEIIFVDCNTPDELPTFPEAIQDLLTPRARSLLRIFRLRPSLYQRFRKGSRLKVLEPLSRNVGVRRSNPANRWILSTNIDMVFMLRGAGNSLSGIVAEIPDGYYGLPRFDLPEFLWESLDRTAPSRIFEALRRWGRDFHLNNVAANFLPELRFDAPGDFQLVLRKQLFQIHGFHEEMVHGYHVDSNLCKRLYLLNGETRSLFDHVLAYHCDHTMEPTFHHTSGRTQNDWERFFEEVTSPYVPEQTTSWGLPEEEVEQIEIGICADNRRSFVAIAGEVSSAQCSTEDSGAELLPQRGQYRTVYDSLQTFPFLINHLSALPESALVGYVGENRILLGLMRQFFERLGNREPLLLHPEVHRRINLDGEPPDGKVVDDSTFAQAAEVFVFDLGLDSAAAAPGVRSGVAQGNGRKSGFPTILWNVLFRTIRHEMKRLEGPAIVPRKFIFLGSHGTWLEIMAGRYVDIIVTPFTTHVQHGFVRPRVRGESEDRTRAAARERARTESRLLSHAGVMALLNGDRALARRILTRAVCMDPRRPKNYLRLGRTLLPWPLINYLNERVRPQSR